MWQTGTTKTGLPPIPEALWQQPLETPVNHHKLKKNHNGSASNTNQMTREIWNKHIIDVPSQTSPPYGFQLQCSGTATEQFREKSENEQVLFLDSSNSCPTDIQETRQHSLTTLDKDTNVFLLTSAIPYIEEKLTRDEQTNEVYLPLTSTVVLKCKQETVHVPLDLHKNVITLF